MVLTGLKGSIADFMTGLLSRLGNRFSRSRICRRFASRLMLGGSREFIRLDLDLWRGGAPAILVDSLLCFSSGLLGVALNGLYSVSSVLVSEIFDLLGLLVGNVIALLQLSIDNLLVLDVDKRAEEGDEGCNQGQPPQWDELDEEVRKEGREECLVRTLSVNIIHAVFEYHCHPIIG